MLWQTKNSIEQLLSLALSGFIALQRLHSWQVISFGGMKSLSYSKEYVEQLDTPLSENIILEKRGGDSK